MLENKKMPLKRRFNFHVSIIIDGMYSRYKSPNVTKSVIIAVLFTVNCMLLKLNYELCDLCMWMFVSFMLKADENTDV